MRTDEDGRLSRETQKRHRKVVGCLLQVMALQLTLFGLLAWFVHVHPILPLDVAITHSFQQNQAPWLRITMLSISYPGSSLLLPALILLTVGTFWAVGDRLEAVFVGGAFDRQSAPQPPAESPGRPATPDGQSRTHRSGSAGIQLPERPRDGLHRILGPALRFRRHPLRGKTLVAYGPPDHLGRVRGADRPLSHLP